MLPQGLETQYTAVYYYVYIIVPRAVKFLPVYVIVCEITTKCLLYVTVHMQASQTFF